MWEDVLGFKVLFFSQDGKTSPILDYLMKMTISSNDLSIKVIQEINRIGIKIYEKQDIKYIKIGKKSFFELRVQSSSNICRVFFILEDKCIIILHAFTKKSQKISKTDLERGVLNLDHYKKYKSTIDSNL